MKYIITSMNELFTEILQHQFETLESVQIHQGSILDLQVDAVVSPANSFGFMDGGIDMLYCLRFGWQLQGRLQDRIAYYHHGELLVGQAMIMETFDPRIPYIISAPTMRVPMELVQTVNAYLATRAVLNLLHHGIFQEGDEEGKTIASVIENIAFPGLGTGVGGLDYETCAKQMRVAFERVLLNPKHYPQTWEQAAREHQAIQSYP